MIKPLAANMNKHPPKHLGFYHYQGLIHLAISRYCTNTCFTLTKDKSCLENAGYSPASNKVNINFK